VWLWRVAVLLLVIAAVVAALLLDRPASPPDRLAPPQVEQQPTPARSP
jgi:hypothetical protein